MVKQVLIIRKDLKMRRGKECAQAAHASMMWLCSKIRRSPSSPIIFSKEEKEWLNEGFTKITLQVDSEKALLDIYNEAKDKGLLSYLIIDSGRTEFNGIPTPTCCAVGPDRSSLIDKVTGKLKLY